MKIKTTIGFALLATTFLSSAASAATLAPTLDTLKSEAAGLSGGFNLSELTGDLPAGAVEVKINDKKYYFTPTGEDAALLATLAGTSAGRLVESESGIFELNGTKYGFDVAAIPNSAFSYADGTESDYNFIVKEADKDGNLTDKYYKVILKPETFSTSKSISWSEVGEDQKDESGVVAVNLPNNQTKYFQYTYTQPDGYETVTKPELVLPTITNPTESSTYQPGGVAINNPAGTDYGDIESKVFKDNKVSGKLVVTSSRLKSLYIQGGAIYNGGTIGNIRSDFINNAVTVTAEGKYARAYAQGGAIYNRGTIGDITGDFIGNAVTGTTEEGYAYADGGAIYNAENATIGHITGDFIGNYASGSGGAIYNNSYNGGDETKATNATIGDISGDFIGNYASGDGGAIYNDVGTYGTYATIGDITGDFIGNHAVGGGAIDNQGTIGNITGNFIGNYASGSDIAGSGAIGNSGTIGDITGDFIGNYASGSGSIYAVAGSGAIGNSDTIGDITGDFIGNYAASASSINSAGGGAIGNIGTIGDITGDFINNAVTMTKEGSGNANANGGAISNNDDEISQGTIGDIIGDFIGNYAKSTSTSYYASALGGAISNEGGAIGDITGDFISNYAASDSDGAYGGAIRNSDTETNATNATNATIGDITGDFIGNYASGSYSAEGGAIYNNGHNVYATIGDITGDFIGNYAFANNGSAYGGAIFNEGTIGDITGDFISNYASGRLADGGAIYNAENAIIGDITGDFIGNTGGAIDNEKGTIGNIIGNFIGNTGGAITNGYNSTIGDITGDFIGNTGGAIANGYATIGDITGDFIGNTGRAIVSSLGNISSISGSFLNNYAESTNNEAYGGAIVTTANITWDPDTGKITSTRPFTIKSNGKDIFFSGNYTKDTRGKIYNAIHVMILLDGHLEQAGLSKDYVSLAFDTSGNGRIIINDNIDGTSTNGKTSQYNLAFKGDGVLNEDGLTDQYISINNDIINAGAVTVDNTTLRFGAYQHDDQTAQNWDGHGRFVNGVDGRDPVTSLSLNNAAFDLYNQYQDTVELKGYKANNSFLHLDVDVENLTADVLKVNGNVEGTTKLVLYPTSGKDIRGESILFAQSTNDTTGNADSFAVWRVYRSPYMFDVKYEQTGTNENKWELTMDDKENDYAGVDPNPTPDPDVPDPEIPDIDIPDINIPTIGNREVAPEVIAYGALPLAGIEQTRSMVDNIAGQTDRSNANHNLWVNPTYYTANYDAPFDIDADIWGLEAGGDLQHDLNNKLGVFVSYRKGNYDMNGDGERYYATIGSEIDIDSYLAGLYYRYDKNNWYGFATLYGGIQQADIKTDDGIKSDTDGIEFGGSVEAGYDYALTDTVYLTPSLGVFYTQVNYDDATDSAGKQAKYNDLRQIELEAGVKLTKVLKTDDGLANVYLKPSIVQTFVDGDEVNITGLGKVNTLDDDTLGRVELGGRYGFNDQLSAYGWANYTFGSDYDATTVGLGLNYAW